MKFFKIIVLLVSLSLLLCSCQSTESFSNQNGAKELSVEQVVEQQVTTQETTEETTIAEEPTTELVTRSPSGPTTIDNVFDPRSVNYLITVNLTTKMLTLFYNQEKMLSFSVGPGVIGDNGLSVTPTGKFSIINKCYNLAYTGHGEYYAGDDPDNYYGHYWMAIAIIGTGVYGIHGTRASWEDKIGGYVSAGCVRMHNWDVPILFDSIYVGTPVWVGYCEQLNEWGVIGFE